MLLADMEIQPERWHHEKEEEEGILKNISVFGALRSMQ